MTHRHKAIKELGPYAYQRCLAPHNCKPASHGGVVWVEVCSCGAKRRTNSNGLGCEERGPWVVKP